MFDTALAVNVGVLCRSASRDMRADMPKLFRRRHAYDTENIAVAVDVMQRRVRLDDQWRSKAGRREAPKSLIS